METPPFTHTIAMDWSGAKARQHKGIAVAVAESGVGAPYLVSPPTGKYWSRIGVLEWLWDFIQTQSPCSRILVGMDICFGLPWQVAVKYFDNPETATAFDLWDLVEAVAKASPETDIDHYGGAFASDIRFAGDFWTNARAQNRQDIALDPMHLTLRQTELACPKFGLGYLENPYKLIGAKQVGKAGLAGMRFLRSLRELAEIQNIPVACWPFEAEKAKTAKVVCAEIYTRVFLKMAGFGNQKVRSHTDLENCLKALGCRVPVVSLWPLSDDQTDALISAAGLRYIPNENSLWNTLWDTAPLGGIPKTKEGWILGVPTKL